MSNIKDIEVGVDSPEKQLLINQIRMEAKINVLVDLVASTLINPGTIRDGDELFKKIDESIKQHVVAILLKLQQGEKLSASHDSY